MTPPKPGQKFRHADDCPDVAKHTTCPSGYIAWHDWAEKTAKTHRCTQCETCGFWVVWVPKAKVVTAEFRTEAEAAEFWGDKQP